MVAEIMLSLYWCSSVLTSSILHSLASRVDGDSCFKPNLDMTGLPQGCWLLAISTTSTLFTWDTISSALPCLWFICVFSFSCFIFFILVSFCDTILPKWSCQNVFTFFVSFSKMLISFWSKSEFNFKLLVDRLGVIVLVDDSVTFTNTLAGLIDSAVTSVSADNKLKLLAPSNTKLDDSTNGSCKVFIKWVMKLIGSR